MALFHSPPWGLIHKENESVAGIQLAIKIGFNHRRECADGTQDKI
jgi:hypothetical protein